MHAVIEALRKAVITVPEDIDLEGLRLAVERAPEVQALRVAIGSETLKYPDLQQALSYFLYSVEGRKDKDSTRVLMCITVACAALQQARPQLRSLLQVLSLTTVPELRKVAGIARLVVAPVLR